MIYGASGGDGDGPNNPGQPGGDEPGGCCDTGRGQGATTVLALLVLSLLHRRRGR